MSVEQWIESMLERGIGRVCFLLAVEPSEAREIYDLYHDAFGTENVRHVPVPDRRLVDPATLRGDVFPFLVGAVEADDRVVVHGLSGLGRTGQILAAWLVWYHEYRPHEAVDTVEKMGRDPAGTIDRGNATRQDLLDLLGGIAR